MSLESNLELNNKLLTQHNALIERLIDALTAGAAVQPAAVAQVQEYRETVPENAVIKRITLDDLEFSDVIALAGFYPTPGSITADMIKQAIGYRDAAGAERVEQIDALDSALRGVKRAEELNKPALLDLSRHVLRFWDELPTIGERRDFAERLLDAPAAGRDSVKPKKASGKEKKQRKGPFYWKTAEGDAGGHLETEDELRPLLDEGCVEINRVEYLQLKERAEKTWAKPNADQPDFAALREAATKLIKALVQGGYRAEAVEILDSFGVKKLGEVADEKLAELIALAEKALEG